MAADNEQLVELRSLGLKPRLNPLNTQEEISSLIINVKRDYIREYHAVYNAEEVE
jgi:hypothetical protein